jgi:prepilin-type N-terminal cleavage/methylation domain-containing protein
MTISRSLNFPAQHEPGSRSAFTLTEIMVAMAIFSLVIVSVIYSHVFGMRMYNVTTTKLNASDQARSALNHVQDEIRAARLLYVGNGTASSFTQVSADNPRAGNSVQIYPTTDTNTFVRYYVDAQDLALMRKTSDGQLDRISNFVTNQIAFRAEDYKGNALTNDLNNRIIKMTLEFRQWEFSSTRAAGNYYDYYCLQTRITRRKVL